MTRHACYDKTDINVRKEKQYVQDKKKYGTCKKGNENGNAICIAMSAAIFQLIALAGSPCKHQRYFVTATWDKANLKEKTREKKVGRERSAQEDKKRQRRERTAKGETEEGNAAKGTAFGSNGFAHPPKVIALILWPHVLHQLAMLFFRQAYDGWVDYHSQRLCIQLFVLETNAASSLVVVLFQLFDYAYAVIKSHLCID